MPSVIKPCVIQQSVIIPSVAAAIDQRRTLLQASRTKRKILRRKKFNLRPRTYRTYNLCSLSLAS